MGLDPRDAMRQHPGRSGVIRRGSGELAPTPIWPPGGSGRRCSRPSRDGACPLAGAGQAAPRTAWIPATAAPCAQSLKLNGATVMSRLHRCVSEGPGRNRSATASAIAGDSATAAISSPASTTRVLCNAPANVAAR